MPIVSNDIQYRLSGGASNSSAAASLGGAISATAAPAGLFDDVASDEVATGDVEYRCYYIRNGHASLTAIGVKVWLQANTPSADTTVDIGLGTSAVSAAEQTVANENTTPAGVTFFAAANEAASLAIGDLAPGQTKAVWVRRTVNAGAAAPVSDGFTLRTKCDTLP
jgi:hypothetical protein